MQSIHRRLYFVRGHLPPETITRLGDTLANPLVNRVIIKTRQEYGDKGMDRVVPRVRLHEIQGVGLVDLEIPDEDLVRLGKEGIVDPETGGRRGPLALDLAQIHAIRNYFDELGRWPTDVEIESLAQTWSEHCKHTIFASAMDDDVPKGLYKSCIQAATNEIRKEKGDRDICVTVFTDNSGAIVFDDEYLVTHKVETHNSPSALDPFGGALTGIVGVNRDTIGFGLGAKPCMNVYGFCVGDPAADIRLFREKTRRTRCFRRGRSLTVSSAVSAWAGTARVSRRRRDSATLTTGTRENPSSLPGRSASCRKRQTASDSMRKRPSPAIWS